MVSSFDDDLPSFGLAPGPGEQSLFRNVRVLPRLGERYAYDVVLPATWSSVDVPATPRADRRRTFSDIGVFSPFQPPLPPVILSFGVKDAGSAVGVANLLLEYCEAENYELVTVRRQKTATGDAVEALVVKERSAVGLLKMRLVMFEDGGELFGLSGMAPVSMYSHFARTFGLAILSFRLANARGAQLPLSRL